MANDRRATPYCASKQEHELSSCLRKEKVHNFQNDCRSHVGPCQMQTTVLKDIVVMSSNKSNNSSDTTLNKQHLQCTQKDKRPKHSQSVGIHRLPYMMLTNH